MKTIPYLFKNRDTGPSSKILLYHAVCEDRDFPSSAGTNVSPEMFERQLRHVSSRFSVISLDTMLDEKKENDGNAIAITFDDGYEDSYENALPVLKKYGLPVAFFLTVSQIGKDWDFPRGSYPGLSWEQVREIAQDPLIEIGSHGLRHGDLTKLSLREAEAEIRSSRVMLEEKLGRPVQYFSYPYGSFSERIKELVRQSNYRAGFSVISHNPEMYSLRRILISRKDTLFRFIIKLSPLYWPLRRII